MRAQAQRDARLLRLRARRDVTALLAGAYKSAFRGAGLTFEELRDYVVGDDASTIEWNATARLGRPIVKRMREERDLVLGLLVDVSDSLAPGYRGRARHDAVRRAAAALAATAIRSQDRVALATFSDRVHSELPPAAGAVQLERALRVLAEPPGGGESDAGPALRWAADRLPRNAVVVLLSDLLLPDPGAALARCARKHEVIALRVADPVDRLPPRAAPVRVRAAEGGARRLWRARRGPGGVAHGRAPLSAQEVRRRGADYAEIETTRLLPSLRRYLELRAERVL